MNPKYYYMMSGDRVVFTTLFHIHRGYCYGNGCKHCPYDPKHTKDNKKLDKKYIKKQKSQHIYIKQLI